MLLEAFTHYCLCAWVHVWIGACTYIHLNNQLYATGESLKHQRPIDSKFTLYPTVDAILSTHLDQHKFLAPAQRCHKHVVKHICDRQWGGEVSARSCVSLPVLLQALDFGGADQSWPIALRWCSSSSKTQWFNEILYMKKAKLGSLTCFSIDWSSLFDHKSDSNIRAASAAFG